MPHSQQPSEFRLLQRVNEDEVMEQTEQTGNQVGRAVLEEREGGKLCDW